MAKVNGSLTILGTLAMNSTKITSLAAGTNATDAVNKSQLDSAISGLTWKDAVRVASNANLASLTGITASDFDGTGQGITLVSGDRVLLKAQSTASENGIYEYDGADLVRSSDMDSGSEADGAAVFVQEGTDADKGFQQTADSVTIGTDAMTWVQFSGTGSFTAGDGIDIAGNVISVDLLAAGGLKFVSTELSIEPSDFAGSGLEDDGSDNLRIAASAAGDGLTGGSGSALALDLLAGGGLKFTAGEVGVEPADFAGAGLEDDGSDNLRIAAAAAGDGLTGGGGSALSLDLLAGGGLKFTAGEVGIEPADFAGSGLEDDGSDNLRIAAAAAGNGLTGGGGSALSVQADGSTIAVGASGIKVSQITSSDAVTGVRTAVADWISTDGTSKAISHNFGTKDVMVTVFDYANSSSDFIPDSIERTDTNTVTITVASAPSGTTVGTDTYRVLIKEIG